MKVCLFLTGTIRPGKVPDLKRVNAFDREQDYYSSIKKWMELGYPIVFVENSNYDSALIDSLFENRHDCEYIKFTTQVSHKGKSHGEAEIVKYALANSTLINKSSAIVKVSGRQYVKNASIIIDYFQKESLDVIGWFKNGLTFADSRFFIGTNYFFENYLLKEFDFIDESRQMYFEHILARSILRYIADGGQWSLPNEAPICEGISGTGNIVYKNSRMKIWKGNVILKLTSWLLNLEY